MKVSVTLALVIALTACGPARQPQKAPGNDVSPVLPAPSAPPAVTNSAPPAQPQPIPTVDPKSSEAAMNAVRSFIDLLNSGKFDEAYMLLGPGAAPRSDFDRQFSRYSDLKVTAGAAGDQEGAAGSVYLSVPLTVSGVLDGERTSRPATAILRRVNDVPGSTEAQRRWHIERIDWKAST